MFNWLKKILLSLVGLLLTIPGAGGAEEDKKEVRQTDPPKETQEVRERFTKDDLIDSLGDMEEKPGSFKYVSAMCYSSAFLPEEDEYQCDICGALTIYKRNSDQGLLVSELPYIKRSLATMPYNIAIDSTGLCLKCGKDKEKTIVMHVKCFNCGKVFSWQVKTGEDVVMLQWLYLKPPIKELDEMLLGIRDKKDVKKGAKYIRECVFCPICRDKIKINKQDN